MSRYDKVDQLLGILIVLCFIFCVVYLSYQRKHELAMIVVVIYYLQNMYSDIRYIKRKLDK